LQSNGPPARRRQPPCAHTLPDSRPRLNHLPSARRAVIPAKAARASSGPSSISAIPSSPTSSPWNWCRPEAARVPRPPGPTRSRTRSTDGRCERTSTPRPLHTSGGARPPGAWPRQRSATPTAIPMGDSCWGGLTRCPSEKARDGPPAYASVDCGGHETGLASGPSAWRCGLGTGYWVLDTRCWMLDAGCWMFDTGRRRPRIDTGNDSVMPAQAGIQYDS